MEGLCAVTLFLFKAGESTIHCWGLSASPRPGLQHFPAHLECRISPSPWLPVGCALVLKGICSLFQKDHGQTSALTSAICSCHKHQALFPRVRLRRMVVEIWCSAGKEPLSAGLLVTFVPEGLYDHIFHKWLNWLLVPGPLFSPSGLPLPKLSALGSADGHSPPLLLLCILLQGLLLQQLQSGTLYKKKPCSWKIPC